MNFHEILASFDNLDKKNFDEAQVSLELSKLKPKDGEAINPDLLKEIVAFDLNELPYELTSSWGTYFGPKNEINDGNGNVYEYPSLSNINEDSIAYWKKRSLEAVNPILRARYRALIIDFNKIINEDKSPYELYISYVKDLLEIVLKNYIDNRHNFLIKLRRALTISLKINSNELIKQCKEAALNISIDESYRNDFKYEFCFDQLVGNKKVALTKEEENTIINELEKKLHNVTSLTNDKIDPWIAEQCAVRLGKYYKQNNREDEVKRVVLLVGRAYDRIINEGSGLQIANWLESLYKLYISFQLHTEASEVLIRLRANGEKVAKEMGAVPYNFEIPGGEMEKYVMEMLIGSPEEIMKRVAIQYIPTKQYAKEQIKEISKIAPTVFIIGQSIQDSKGRTIARIGSLEQDLDGHIIRQISQTLLFSAVFLRQVFQTGLDKRIIDTNSILTFLKTSPVIDPSRLSIIKRGLDAFFESDYLTTIHFLIPQLEEAIRNTVEKLGGNVLKPSKRGTGFHLKTLDDLLRDDLIIELLGEDFVNYLRILLTDQRGWNLRNNVCHGMSGPETFNATNSDRIVHALICLGLITTKP